MSTVRLAKVIRLAPIIIGSLRAKPYTIQRNTPVESWNKVTGLTSLTDLVRMDLAIWGINENMVKVAASAPIKVQNMF